jgi:hypothetical protein
MIRRLGARIGRIGGVSRNLLHSLTDRAFCNVGVYKTGVCVKGTNDIIRTRYDSSFSFPGSLTFHPPILLGPLNAHLQPKTSHRSTAWLRTHVACIINQLSNVVLGLFDNKTTCSNLVSP